MRNFVFAAAFALTVAGLSPHADASTVFLLDQISSSTIGSGVQGSVTLTQDASDPLHQIDVVVSLTSGALLVNTGGPHTPLVFNLDAAAAGATVTVTSINVPATFYSPVVDPDATPYGEFTNGIGYNGSQGGVGHGSAGPLTFTVFNAGGISIADFVKNTDGYYFGADLLGTSGGTGSVASKLGTTTACTGPSGCEPPPVPLPAGLPLFGSAFLGVAVVGWLSRRRRIEVSFA